MSTAGRAAFVLLLVLIGCQDQAPSLGPTKVTIASATPTAVRLRNSGGSGMYYLEVWGRSTSSPSGCFDPDKIEGRCPVTASKVDTRNVVLVDKGYDESRSITVSSAEVYGYKVYSRSVDTVPWLQTDCVRAVSGAWLTFPCP